MVAVCIRHSVWEFATQPVILWILLGGKPKRLPLNSGFNNVMRTTPICEKMSYPQCTDEKHCRLYCWKKYLKQNTKRKEIKRRSFSSRLHFSTAIFSLENKPLHVWVFVCQFTSNLRPDSTTSSFQSVKTSFSHQCILKSITLTKENAGVLLCYALLMRGSTSATET